MYQFEFWGTPLTSQKIVPGNTACATLATSYRYTEWTTAFAAGDVALVVGAWLAGDTSGVMAQVVSVTLISGALDGSGVGTLRLKSKYHPSAPTTEWTADEVFSVSTAASGNFTGIPAEAPKSNLYAFPKGTPAKCALVSVLTQTGLINIDGGKPNQTALVGLPIKDGGSILLRDIGEIIRFKVIDYANNTAGITNIQYFF
jgi:hypothetical protein